MVLFYSFFVFFFQQILDTVLKIKTLLYILDKHKQMLQTQLILSFLLVLFVGGFGQQFRSDARNWKENRYDQLEYRQRRQAEPSQSRTPQSVNNINQQKIVQPGFSNESPITSSSSSLSLASSMDCKADIQKYCVRGGTKLISNLKVLECINDLDNVSLSTI